MISRAKFFIFLFLILFLGCIKEVNFKSESVEQQPVLTALFTNNDNVESKVRLSWSVTPEAPSIAIPEEARVIYYLDDKIVGEAKPNSEGYCLIPPNFPGAGRSFTVEAHIPGQLPIRASDVIPYKAEVFEATYRSAGFRDEQGDPVFSAQVRFHDKYDERNYYELIFFNASQFYTSYYTTPFEVDAVLKNEGDQDFEPLSFFFSDELFNGETVTIEILLRNYINSSEMLDHSPFYVPEDGRYVLFRTISRNWYEYLKGWTRHRYTRLVGQGISSDATFQDFQNLLFAPEPTPMFSNIEDGLGLVAGSNTQIIKMND